MSKTSSFDVFSSPVVIVVPESPLPITQSDMSVEIHYADIAQDAPITASDLAGVLIQVKGKMHVRGDATASLPKKQYGVKLHHEPQSGHFLGMEHGGKHWVFNDCGAVDYTLLRNVLAFTMQRALGQYAPQYKFFELFVFDPGFDLSNISASTLGDAYQGLYLNFDKIRFESARVQAPQDWKSQGSAYAIIQANQSSAKYLSLAPSPPLTGNVEIYEPELKDLTEAEQGDFTRWYIDSTLTHGWAGRFAQLYSNYVASTPPSPIPESDFPPIRSSTDYASFAAYFVLNEIAKDPDGYHKSTFMVKRQDTCFAGPLWDKNKSYGNKASCSGYPNDYVSPEGWLFSLAGQSPCWWHVMIRDPQFQQTVQAYWKLLLAELSINPLQGDWIDALIDSQVQDLNTSGALARDSARWPSAFNQGGAYATQVAQLKNYLCERVAWIDNNLTSMLASYQAS
ncbi:CotH kinase family protein [Dyella sp.]|uniref:CotH kinase family protein n=1 Tax=Dyella sp. TaxID=1869338 RepID=UPI002ED3E495